MFARNVCRQPAEVLLPRTSKQYFFYDLASSVMASVTYSLESRTVKAHLIENYYINFSIFYFFATKLYLHLIGRRANHQAGILEANLKIAICVKKKNDAFSWAFNILYNLELGSSSASMQHAHGGSTPPVGSGVILCRFDEHDRGHKART